jgi:hypothetical protein
MNAYTNELCSDSYSSPARARSPATAMLALHHAARTVEAAGSRIGAIVPLTRRASE